MTRPTQEIDAYLDGEPTPDQARALQAWIQADKANAKAFLAAIRLHQQIGTQLRKDRFDQAIRGTGQTATTKDGDAAIQALAELARLHEEGLKQPIDLELHRKQQAQAAAASQGRSRRLSMKLIATGSLAAAIAIAGLTVLAINLFSGPEEPIAEQPDEPIFVATLTSATDAAWENQAGDRVDLPINSPMTQGQHLTLTEGFAEITTNRGAIAILEAPATIELLDNNNALRLHTGKLVGICETESSKGFLVRTPHMDITDLGTRFGVDASDRDATEVHIFDGLVEIARSVTPTESPLDAQRLGAGEAARVVSGSQAVTRLSTDTKRFASLTPIVIDLPATGEGLKYRQPETRWSVVSRQGVPLDSHGTPKVNSNRPEEKGKSGFGASQWLIWDQTQRGADNNESFVFQTEVHIPDSLNPDTARITLDCAADNRLVAIHVNGQRVAVDAGENSFVLNRYVIDRHLVSGPNTIGFEIENIWYDTQKTNAVGLRVVWQLRGMPLQSNLPTDSN